MRYILIITVDIITLVQMLSCISVFSFYYIFAVCVCIYVYLCVGVLCILWYNNIVCFCFI